MKKENCTKGPIQLVPHQDNVDVHCVETIDERRIAEVLPYDLTNGAQEADANAELIAEAFNVLHETGYTPRELADRLQAIHDGLNTCTSMEELREAAAMCIVQSTLRSCP